LAQISPANAQPPQGPTPACSVTVTKDCSNKNFANETFFFADLRGVNFSYANFTNSIIYSSNFSGANFTGAIFTGSLITCHSNLANSTMIDARFDNVRVWGQYTRRYSGNLFDGFLSGCVGDESGPDLSETNFSNANLTNTTFAGFLMDQVRLNDANFNGSNLTGVTFDRTSQYATKISNFVHPSVHFSSDGTVLYANSGVWNPSVSYTYQWRRDGLALIDQISDRYSPSLSDYGHVLSVSVTATSNELAPVTVTSDPVNVQLGSLDKVVSGNTCPAADVDSSPWMTSSGAEPAIVGDSKVSKSLQSRPGVWGKGMKFCRLWVENGQVVNNTSTGSIYLATSRDVGQSLQLFIVATDRNGTSKFRFSQPVVIKLKSFKTADKPDIAGNLKAGSTVVSIMKVWSNRVDYSYQWFRNGSPIYSATSARYKLTQTDSKTEISVRVCGQKADYEELCLMSDPKQVK